MLCLLNISPHAVFCCVTPESGQFDPDSAPHTHHAEPDGQVLTYRGTSENVYHIVLCQSILAFTAPLFHYHPICPPAGPARHTHAHLFSLSLCCHKIKLFSPSTCFTPCYASSHIIFALTRLEFITHTQLLVIIFFQTKYVYANMWSSEWCSFASVHCILFTYMHYIFLYSINISKTKITKTKTD